MKNNIEIKNMINCHILDGITYKISLLDEKKNRKSITEFQAQNKLSPSGK